MPHDVKGRLVEPGDKVLIEAVVESVNPGEEYCNVTVKTARPMKPSDSPTTIVLNAHQVEKIG